MKPRKHRSRLHIKQRSKAKRRKKAAKQAPPKS